MISQYVNLISILPLIALLNLVAQPPINFRHLRHSLISAAAKFLQLNTVSCTVKGTECLKNMTKTSSAAVRIRLFYSEREEFSYQDQILDKTESIKAKR